MKVGLIDVDSHNFPNLCLMKLSSWHKSQGDEVEMLNPILPYDKVYASKVFDSTYSDGIDYPINCRDIVYGGTGYNNDVLPPLIEHQMPDYSLYGIEDTAYGFLTRGCPRACHFCIVSGKEGRVSRKVAELDEFWSGQKHIVLLDPNITASKDCEELFQTLVDSKSWIDFSQGIDIRCMTDKKAELLNQMKLKMLHFAWDNYEMNTYEDLKRFRPTIKHNKRKLRVYVLTNFNTTHEQDLERIYKLRELEYDPFVMIYDKPNAPRLTRQMARWVNNKFVWRSVPRFDDYQYRKE